ncbi:MAG TPA: crotonase/enoyl-CoA hydratase family protein [Rhizomicrobium sp.]
MNSEPSSVRVERDGPVTTIILARPSARNAVDRATADALVRAFTRFEHDGKARAAVLWGEGGTFSAGADLKALAAGNGNRISPPRAPLDRCAGDAPMGSTRMCLSKPVIAAISGHAVAGGLELALWCDLRLAEEDAVLGVYCRRWGIPLMDGGTVRLPRMIGFSRALDLILTGRAVDAREALAMGLVNRVVPKGRSRCAAEKLALDLARFPQKCLRNDRQSVYEQDGCEMTTALAREFELALATLESGESRAGAQLFASKGRTD